MIYDIDMLRRFYAEYGARVGRARQAAGRPLTYAEKVFLAHAAHPETAAKATRGTDYADYRPDRVAMQDATAQMALLQFMNAGRDTSAVPATVHCDHLIRASVGAAADLAEARQTNAEVYGFLRSAAARYGIGFWGPGAGIIHQVLLENYAFPAGMMIGSDSHTPNAGGMGMAAIGVGGADVVDVMAGLDWELKVPRLIGVRLTGRLSGWTSAKDVVLCLAGRLTAKGATNAVIEYFGDGVEALPCTGRATICNFGAEMGATTSIFPYGEATRRYLMATGREEVASMADAVADDLRADAEVTAEPEKYYDQVIDIDLSTLTPYVNGPFTPDAACPVSEMPARAEANDYPREVEVVLIGSCTNSSYQDLRRACAVLKAAKAAGFKPKAQLLVNPGSELIRATAERDGLLDELAEAGAIVMANACGPCIGQWKRQTDDATRRNTIITTFNRNFAKRADGNPNTFAFITSPEAAVGYAITGTLTAHPSFSPEWAAIAPEACPDLPEAGFAEADIASPLLPPSTDDPIIPEGSERLQRLTPFAPWDGKDFNGLHLLIKTKGKCTTDHISQAGPWLKYRGHLENISRNMLLGAINAFTGEAGCVTNPLTGAKETPAAVATALKAEGQGCIVVAEDNYGEGSSREHAAMEPRFLNVKVILAKSFARIHESNLKKQGVLALTFANAADYDRVREDDRIDVAAAAIAPGSDVTVTLHHSDGTTESLTAHHTYNDSQIAWLHAGSALGFMAKNHVG